MPYRPKVFWLFVAVAMASAPAFAETQVARHKITEWQGPEIAQQCVKWGKTDGAKVCVGHKKSCVSWAKWPSGKSCKGWKLKCSKWAKSKATKTCVGHRYVWKKHKRYLVAESDLSIRNLPEQTKQISDACLAAAAASLVVTAPLDSIGSVIDDGLPAAEEMFKLCIKTTQTLGRVVEDSISLRLEKMDEY